MKNMLKLKEKLEALKEEYEKLGSEFTEADAFIELFDTSEELIHDIFLAQQEPAEIREMAARMANTKEEAGDLVTYYIGIKKLGEIEKDADGKLVRIVSVSKKDGLIFEPVK